jgi:hypothetical protein
MPGRSIAIVQSSYVPWKGYFDLVAMVDEFILYDDRQFTRRDWRNRNRIKTASGPRWLTIPVKSKGRYYQRIDETETDGSDWRAQHFAMIAQAYSKSPFYDDYRPLLEELYLGSSETRLSFVNRRFLEAICGQLGIDTEFRWSTEFDVDGDRTSRLLNLCLATEATTYVSGPSARAYLEEAQFDAAGIEVRYVDYSGYPEYPQAHPPFVHEVSVLDLLLCTGPEARRFLKSSVPRVTSSP